jgi:hypothetical protein
VDRTTSGSRREHSQIWVYCRHTSGRPQREVLDAGAAKPTPTARPAADRRRRLPSSPTFSSLKATSTHSVATGSASQRTRPMLLCVVKGLRLCWQTSDGLLGEDGLLQSVGLIGLLIQALLVLS